MILKILLIPSYRSTDFDVHRNWLAITRHLPLSMWYFDDVNGTTVHTLDYPPSFAFFEYFLSNNFITDFLIQSGILNERCFQLLGDDDNSVGMDCVVFQRLTVVLVGDMVYLWGVWAMCQSFIGCCWCIDTSIGCGCGCGCGCCKSNHEKKMDDAKEKKKNSIMMAADSKVVVVMILAVFNPGLILLDHVHFQYNGMLLGILLLSISFVLRSKMTLQTLPPNGSATSSREIITASILYACLVTFKHLYMTLGPVYLFYMLGRVFCQRPQHLVQEGHLGSGGEEGRQKRQQQQEQQLFWLLQQHKKQLQLFFSLVASVLLTLVLPFVPFIVCGSDEDSNNSSAMNNWKGQITQILSRLFPFQRGLCHDYWAGNVWALYKFAEKSYKFIAVRFPMTKKSDGVLVFQDITPPIAAIFLLVAMIPAMVCSWKVARNILLQHSSPHWHQKGFLYCIVYASMTSFMLSYHVHEKAIMTAIVPMIFLSVTDKTSARLFLRMSTLGHFGLLPLLYKPTELLLKVFLHTCYLMLSITLLEKIHSIPRRNIGGERESKCNGLLMIWDKIGLGIMVLILLYTESLHFFLLGYDRMEFLPLLITSVFCAVGLFVCWIHCGMAMIYVT